MPHAYSTDDSDSDPVVPKNKKRVRAEEPLSGEETASNRSNVVREIAKSSVVPPKNKKRVRQEKAEEGSSDDDEAASHRSNLVIEIGKSSVVPNAQPRKRKTKSTVVEVLKEHMASKTPALEKKLAKKSSVKERNHLHRQALFHAFSRYAERNPNTTELTFSIRG